MNRNTETRFSRNPANVGIQRSAFDRSTQHKTTFNAGELVPIYVDEVLPGDTFILDTSFLIRMSTPIFATMDNLFADYYYFFVPNRLVWEHWKEFCGENNLTAWEAETEYFVPQVSTGTWNKGSVGDYFGLPIGAISHKVNALPFRAYQLIFNDWFRDQNLIDPVLINKGEADEPISTFQSLLPVCKYHDYFTSCLPAPQKGASVFLPFEGQAPVVTGDDMPYSIYGDRQPLRFDNPEGSYTELHNVLFGTKDYAQDIVAMDGIKPFLSEEGVITSDLLSPTNLYAQLDQSIAPTINSLRQAFQIQKLLERDARGGTRYTEMIKSHFGVTSPDARQQRPEYLGGKRVPINISQVVQMSSSDATSPQGNVAGYSKTTDYSSTFTKSFTEHGYIIGLVAIRQEHTYQDGINRMFNRRRRYDFYYPALANIGEQAVLNKEIYAYGNGETGNEVFGYQEAWADYRYKPSYVSGAFKSKYTTSLDAWHYADDYDSLPMLSDEWIKETKDNIDRTLAVSSDVEDQFIADFYFNVKSVRPMPTYSIPGLIDHN